MILRRTARLIVTIHVMLVVSVFRTYRKVLSLADHVVQVARTMPK